MSPKWRGDRARKITLTVTINPKKKGRYVSHHRFDLYRNGMTVAQYVQACKLAPNGHQALNDINWDLDHKFITLSQPT